MNFKRFKRASSKDIPTTQRRRQVLEEFSSSDPVLKDAMATVRRKIAAKSYVCAPNFWQDLRLSLKAIEQKRAERAAKMKAQQVRRPEIRCEIIMIND